MKLFELCACWEESYDCPDNGPTKICDTYETIAFAVDDDAGLRSLAAELELGYKGGYWSVTRSRHLRKLYPGYDDHRDTKYVVTEVSDLIISPPISNNHKEPQ